MKNILTFVLSIVSTVLLGQDTIFYDNDWNKVSSMNNAVYFEITQCDPIDTSKLIEKIYFKSG